MRPPRVRELMCEQSGYPGIGGRVGLEKVRVAYQNVGGGVEATHEFLEFCKGEQVGVAFVGECRVGRQGGSTQTQPSYVIVGRVSKDSRVVANIRRDLVEACRLVVSETRFVYLQIGDYKFGGVYSRCGSTVARVKSWLEGVGSSLRDCRWVVLGDWNASHERWYLDGGSNTRGRVLSDWVDGLGARVSFGARETFCRRRLGRIVSSRIDFCMLSPDADWESWDASWGLSDHCAIGGESLVEVGGGRELVREGIDWPLVACTLLDADEGWYDGLLGESAYEKLVDFRRRHVKSLRIGGRSKRWWIHELGTQVAKVRLAHRGGRGGLNWEPHRREVEVMRAMVKAAKEKCWRDFCTKEGAQSPWGVVRWAKDPSG